MCACAARSTAETWRASSAMTGLGVGVDVSMGEGIGRLQPATTRAATTVTMRRTPSGYAAPGKLGRDHPARARDGDAALLEPGDDPADAHAVGAHVSGHDQRAGVREQLVAEAG